MLTDKSKSQIPRTENDEVPALALPIHNPLYSFAISFCDLGVCDADSPEKSIWFEIPACFFFTRPNVHTAPTKTQFLSKPLPLEKQYPYSGNQSVHSYIHQSFNLSPFIINPSGELMSHFVYSLIIYYSCSPVNQSTVIIVSTIYITQLVVLLTN